MSELELICAFCGKLMDLCECPEPEEPNEPYDDSEPYLIGVFDDAKGWF